MVVEIGEVTTILRGYNYEQVRLVCQVLSETRFKSVEITTNSPKAFTTVSKISKEFPDLSIGVGTVLNLSQAQKAYNSGAKYILSPINLSREVIDFCKNQEMGVVSSAMTPTEIYQSYKNGVDIIKIFPASSLSTSFAQDVKAPLGDIKMMAVGGVNKNNVKDFFSGGYDYVGVGSGLFDKRDVINCNKLGLIKSIKEFEERLQVND